ncbi:Syntaxin-binding protein 5 [Glycine soja]|uniref:Syntaxin-binding protein 5 n=1 Tax=Glycine soja TaxID=3848 RepID=A0A445H204_GLYSO|nr:Syntaxin-binding protein 5 [Glycine soja]
MRLSWQQAVHGQRWLRITVHFDGKKIGRSKRARCTILVIHAAPEDEALHEETENRNTNLASRGTKQTKARRRSSWIGSSSTMFSRFFHKSPPQQRPQQQDVVQDSFPSPNFDPRVALHHGVPSTASILAFDNIQRLLAVGTLDGKIKLFGGDNIEGTLISPKQASFKNLEFLENQGFLASVSSDNEIQVWDLKSKQIASALQWESVITSFSVIMAPVTYGNTSDLSAEKLTSNSPLKSDSRVQANIQSENAQVEFESATTGSSKYIRKVNLIQRCCWTTTFKKEEKECVLVLLYQSGDIQLRAQQWSCLCGISSVGRIRAVPPCIASIKDFGRMLPRMVGCKSAWQIWDKIHTHLCKSFQIRNELQDLSLVNRLVSEYLLQIQTLVNSLTAVGETVTSTEHLDLVLDGLPLEYDSSISLISRCVANFTIDEVETMLLEHESRIDMAKKRSLVSVNLTEGNFRANDSFQPSNSNLQGTILVVGALDAVVVAEIILLMSNAKCVTNDENYVATIPMASTTSAASSAVSTVASPVASTTTQAPA